MKGTRFQSFRGVLSASLLAFLLLPFCVQAQQTPSLDSLLRASYELAPDEAITLFEQHFHLLASSNLQDGKVLADRALRIATDAEDIDLEFIARGFLAHASYLLSDFVAAGEMDEWRIQYCMDHGEPGCLGDLLNGVANFIKRFGEHEKALEYLDQGLPDCRAAGDSICVSTNFDHRGVILMQTGRPDEAQENFERCLDIRLHVGDTVGLGYVYNNLAWVAAERQQTQKALDYLKKSLEIREFLGEGYGIASSLTNIGETYFMDGQYEQALNYWQQALSKTREVGAPDMLVYILEHSSEAYLELDQPEMAVGALKEAHRVKDSLLTNEAARASAELEIRYETERNENRIAIQQLRMEKQDQQIQTQFLAGGALLLLLSGLGLFLFQRSRNKQQAVLQEARIEHQEDLLATTIEVQESERRRIARDLHDGIGQQLTGLKLAWQKLASEQSSSDSNELGRITGILSETARDVRELSHQMMPRSLSELGLVPALEDLVEQAFRDGGIEGEFEHFGDSSRFEESKETALYRIAQELLGNIGKHAAASQASVQLIRKKEAVMLVVEDNGKGFDPSNINGRSHGLANIHTRARAIGGQVRFESAPGEGTVVTVRVPVSGQTKDL